MVGIRSAKADTTCPTVALRAIRPLLKWVFASTTGSPPCPSASFATKSPRGNQIETRGKAKYLGGVGTKVTGISRREFKPNLQRVKITTPNGTSGAGLHALPQEGIVRKAARRPLLAAGGASAQGSGEKAPAKAGKQGAARFAPKTHF
jgi:large subunit ribosomal protein L28